MTNSDSSAPSTERLHAIISGRVQGVSFRYFTTQVARELNLVGWVKNRQDGTVEVVAEGPRDQLDNLYDFLHKGSPIANVKNVEATWQAATGEFAEFKTTYR